MYQDMVGFSIRVVALCCVTTDACVRVRSSMRQTNLLLHPASMNEPTDMYARCMLSLKMRDVYQMTLVLPSNDNDGLLTLRPSIISNTYPR